MFFSLKALLLRQAMAQIFSILWPSLLGRWPHWCKRPNKQQLVTSCHVYQNLAESIRIYQNLSDFQNLSGSIVNDTTTNMIKTKEQRGPHQQQLPKYQTTAPLHLSVSTPFDSSCCCISFCKHCSQSAASSASATAACMVSALTVGSRNDVDEMNFQGHTESDSRNMSKHLQLRELQEI